MAKKQATTNIKAGKSAGKPKKVGSHRGGKSYWLVKSEPQEFSIDDLGNAPKQTTYWDGVRNYQARNMLRDDMKIGDLVLFYHSNAEPPGIAGIAKVVRAGYPDHTAFDSGDKHFDPKSKADEPRWFMVDIQLVEKFPRELSLAELKQESDLQGMVLLQKGSRLSVQPVSESHFNYIKALAKKKKAGR